MSPRTNGFERDLNLVRRRAWLFIPFFVLGLLAAFAAGTVAGDSTAVATMQLDTMVHDMVPGGDRGLRIFEAQAMTTDDRFKAAVREEIGDPNFDIARFVVVLRPVSIAEGVSRGTLTVSIADSDKATAGRYRDAWVSVFEHHYTALDGLFRTRFIESKQDVADLAEQRYTETFAAIQGQHPELPLDELVRSPDQRGFTLVEELSRQEGQLLRQLAEVEGALASGNVTGALASAVLGTPIADGQAQAALEGRRASLEAAIGTVREQRAAYSDASLDPELRTAIDDLRSLADLRLESATRLNNARVVITSAQSDVETTYTFSGGVAGSMAGRVAIVVAITVVFGVIAIYALEWLSQVRTGVEERETA
ncbi:MAG: hypothetical protein M0R74_00050 [Dehalococcoidia bacterium]|nr:hypothetical protein [Dehalococcoidia bacterium]